MDYHFYTRNNSFIARNDELVSTATNYGFDTITIGNQTWSDYIRINDGGDGIHVVDVSGIGTQYYYTWGAAERIAESCNGWHLPTVADMNELINYCNPSAGYKLKSVDYWASGTLPYEGGGCDLYGFNMLPLGMIIQNDANPSWVGYYGNIWGYDTVPGYSNGKALLRVSQHDYVATTAVGNGGGVYFNRVPFKLIKD